LGNSEHDAFEQRPVVEAGEDHNTGLVVPHYLTDM